MSMPPIYDRSNRLLSKRESSRLHTANVEGSEGLTSDIVPEAPFKPLPTVPRLTNQTNGIPQPTASLGDSAIAERPLGRNRLDTPAASDDPIEAPGASAAKTVDSIAPKLLPTPVSEQVAAPKYSDMPEPVKDISDEIAVPEKRYLPPSEALTSDARPTDLPPTGLPPVEESPGEKSSVPEVPQQPLPDILVDPFIEDVGQFRGISRSRVALASSHESVPVNALREGEPKRLSPSQKGIIARELAAPRATRIIFKRYFDEKIEP